MQFISLPSEKKIKHYEWNFKSLLGTGSFGRVYCARDTLHNSLVAIKVMTLEFLSENFLHSLSNELQLMQKLKDPHIVQLIDMYHSTHNIYLV